jgi:ketosteroid isomerase-like protein
MLKLIKLTQTKWEEFEGRKQKKLQSIASLERLLRVTQDKLKQAVLEGKSVIEFAETQEITKNSLTALRKEIEILENEQANHEEKHLKTKIQELKRQGDKIMERLEPHRKAYEEAKTIFEEAEKDWRAKDAEAKRELEVIYRQKGKYELRLTEKTPESLPEPKHSVEEWLKLCRDGKVQMYISGQDPNLDEAYRQYEQEKAELRQWAHQEKLARKTTGMTPDIPECSKHYSRKRLEKIFHVK